jgi:hypothetical protein
MQRVFANAALGLALTVSLSLASVQAAPTPQQRNGISYINGGVGMEEQNAMRALSADYNLRLTFATKQTGAYRSDVQLSIADAKGNSVLNVAEGKTFKRSVRIGNAPKEMTLHWENDSPDDPGVQD